ncbi:MAG: M23 family metallopeptidase [Treponema sp.]|nr:M23 family metallopeptidase [Treponema sp.]
MQKKLLFILIINLCFAITVQAQIRYVVIPESPRPGDPITVALTAGISDVQLIVNERQIAKAGAFLIPAENGNPSFITAIITVPSTAEPGDAILRLNNEIGVFHEIPITIAPRTFRSETINLDAALTSLVADPNPERTAESERLWAILATTGNQVYHTGPFLLPVTSTRRTSQFGTRRINAYSDGRRVTSIHAGVDFGIPTGTEVRASGRGRVVLSRMRILTGFSVILEHAPGVYSLYYHLDSVIAQEGSIVAAGSVIGLSGSTGFSTGPHLHWEFRVSTENTDPDVLVARPLIDKELIISRLFN